MISSRLVLMYVAHRNYNVQYTNVEYFCFYERGMKRWQTRSNVHSINWGWCLLIVKIKWQNYTPKVIQNSKTRFPLILANLREISHR